MPTNHDEEIAASVAAHQTLGPGYDQALAEGLVERIGEEIDNRIAAQVNRRFAADSGDRTAVQMDPHAGCRHVRRAQRRAERTGRPSVLVPLGSLAAAILASLTVLLASETNVATGNGGFTKSGPGGAAFMLTALIWIIIGVINVAYARRQS
ncbi:MAG: hypothetical protein ACRDNF_20240 [Streptosporangiaceae bacterium]